jgi:predicted nucleic acid-binding protein
MSWLADTNVISELSRNTPNAKVRDWLYQREDALYLSVLTLGELEKGVRKITNATHRVRLQSWIRNSVLPWFSERILVVDRLVAARWGELNATLPAIGSLIAATALHHQLTVATRTTRGLNRTGVSTINPWE